MGFTISALVWATGTHSVLLKAPVIMLCLGGMLSLGFTKYHYSIDILAGFAATLIVWHLYSWGARVPGMQSKGWAHGFVALDKVDLAEGETDELASAHDNRISQIIRNREEAQGRNGDYTSVATAV